MVIIKDAGALWVLLFIEKLEKITLSPLDATAKSKWSICIDMAIISSPGYIMSLLIHSGAISLGV